MADYAARISGRKDLPVEAEAKVARLYQILFARKPVAEELAKVSKFLGEKPDGARWQSLVHALLLVNEFNFID